jgi:hypothetical protein
MEFAPCGLRTSIDAVLASDATVVGGVSVQARCGVWLWAFISVQGSGAAGQRSGPPRKLTYLA